MALTPEEIASRKLIGRRIRAARNAAGKMTQEELGDLIGRQQKVVSDWELSKRRFGFSDLWPLAEALRVSVEHLIGAPRTAAERRAFEADAEEVRHLREHGTPLDSPPGSRKHAGRRQDHEDDE